VPPSPTCFAWWRWAVKSSPTPPHGCRAGAHTCTPARAAWSEPGAAGRFPERYARRDRSVTAGSPATSPSPDRLASEQGRPVGCGSWWRVSYRLGGTGTVGLACHELPWRQDRQSAAGWAGETG